MTKEFTQLSWDAVLEEDCRQLVRLAVREDLGRGYDWTTVSLVSPDAPGAARVVARQEGVMAGGPAIAVVLDEMEIDAQCRLLVEDGAAIQAGSCLALLQGAARDLLVAERTILNLLGHLAGIATHTARFVQQVRGTGARVYDTRKTLPGYRRLEKYAVRCGGGFNHRTGLSDAVLIKDNHLALGAGQSAFSPAEAVLHARQFLETTLPAAQASQMVVEIEVDSLAQLDQVLPAGPDIVLLDNMPPELLRQAVQRRDQQAPQVQLEASGGIHLATIRAVAETGVERISVGGLTHGAIALDVALDWGAAEGAAP